MIKPLRILIADDHEVVRQGVRAVLESQAGWSVEGEARNGLDAVVQALEIKPDIVLLDITMPKLNGLEAARQILEDLPETQIMILATHGSDKLMKEVLAAGARGYILKTAAKRDMVSAVRSLCDGRPFVVSKAADVVQTGFGRRNMPASAGVSVDAHLTSRERQIVQLLSAGKTSKEVASALGISTKTVDTHRANVMRKLRLHTIADVVRYAIRSNIIEP